MKYKVKKPVIFLFILLFFLPVYLAFPNICLAEKFVPEYCRGAVRMSYPLRAGKVMEADDLPSLEQYVSENAAFYEKFMEHYRTTFPTMRPGTPLDLESMDFESIMNADIPNFRQIREARHLILAFGDFYSLKEQYPKAVETYISLVKLGVDLINGFGGVKTMIGLVTGAAVMNSSLERVGTLLCEEKLSPADEQAVLDEIHGILAQKAPLRTVLAFERAMAEKFDFCGPYMKKMMPSDIQDSLVEKAMVKGIGELANRQYRTMVATIYDDLMRGADAPYPEGRKLFQQAARYFDDIGDFVHQDIDENDPEHCRILVNWGGLRVERGDTAKASELFGRALSMLEASPEVDFRIIIEIGNSISDCLPSLGTNQTSSFNRRLASLKQRGNSPDLVKEVKDDLRIFTGALDMASMDGKTVTDLKTLEGPYVKRLPTDPWGNDYFFDKDKDLLGSSGPDGKRGTSDDITIPYQ